MATIPQIATGDDFSILLSATQFIDSEIEGSDLVGALSGTTQLTVFAPNTAANPNLIGLDIQAASGVVHVLDNVLLPVDLLQLDGNDLNAGGLFQGAPVFVFTARSVSSTIFQTGGRHENSDYYRSRAGNWPCDDRHPCGERLAGCND